MKKYIISGFIFLAALSFSSCSQDKLDISQKGVVAIENFYKTDADAEAAIVSVYTSGHALVTTGAGFAYGWCIAPPFMVLSNAPSDDIYYASGNPMDHQFGLEINEFRPTFISTNSVVNQVYRACYNLVYTCNLVITNFKYGDSAVKDRCISEARVMRAWAHFILASYWNNPPLVDKLISPADKPSNTPHAEVLAWCIKEFDESAPYLPSKSSLTDGDRAVCITKEAAYAFEGKAQLFAEDFAGAKVSLKKVIDSNKYDLVPGTEMNAMFHRAGDGNKEKVFEFNFVDNPGAQPSNGYHFQYNASCFWRDLNSKPNSVIPNDGWGAINPSKKFCDALIANDGIDSYRRKAWIITYDELINDMPYDNPDLFDATGKPLRGATLGNDNNGIYGNAGYWSYKTAPLRSDLLANDKQNTDQNQIVMRYAEVLLMYAEACAKTTDDGTGLAALQKVQNRAGSNTVSTTLTMDAVKSEKRFEMFLEGCRFNDLVRWGDAATVLANQGKEPVPYWNEKAMQKDANGNYLYPRVYEGYCDYTHQYAKMSECGFKAGKNEYMPYPYSTTSINPNLIQNPHWDE